MRDVHFLRCRLTGACLLLVVLGSCLSVGCDPVAGSPYRDYLGRYRLDDDVVLVVSERDGLLTVLPSLWRRAEILEPVAEDRFFVLLYPDATFEFHRDATGRVNEIEVAGSELIDGRARRISPNERVPAEALLADDPDAALRLLALADQESPARALALAYELLDHFPSHSATAAAFLGGVAERFPTSAAAQEARGMAWMSAGDRDQALTAFRRAVELDEDSTWSRLALRHLDTELSQPDAGGWQVEFALADLFRAPTDEEIEQVRQGWRQRDLSPVQVTVAKESTLKTEHGVFQQLVLSHLVHGERHYAAVLVPVDAEPGSCPVILDVKGISESYYPRRVTQGDLGSFLILRDQVSRFVIAVPGLRGEILEVDGETYLSEGDRTNGWDGAADDTIALLSAVLEVVPEADPERVGAFGVSRGASVALLAAARDQRFDCVAAWAGPTDWFRLMGTWGWTLEEQVSDGLLHRWEPGQGGGGAAQFIEWFLRDPIDKGSPSLAQVRARVAASSPLYFVDTLPPCDVQYGTEDRSVPVANGIALRDRLEALGHSAPEYQVSLNEGSGHDLPYPWAFDQAREFLLWRLVEPGNES